MKKTVLKYLMLAGILLFATGCAFKPFEEVQSIPGKTVVHVYWPRDLKGSDTLYDVYTGGKRVGALANEGYITAVVEGRSEITVRNRDAVIGALEHQTLTIDNDDGDIVYYKVVAPFNVVKMDPAVAKEEIRETFNKVTGMESDDEKNQNEAKTEASPAESKSVVDELERLVDLKNKGAITEEEYQVLKARVIGR